MTRPYEHVVPDIAKVTFQPAQRAGARKPQRAMSKVQKRADSPSIVIVNSYGDENRGSAALNAAAILAVRAYAPDSVVSIVSLHASEDDYSRIYRHTNTTFPEVVILPPPVKSRRGNLAGLRKVGAQLGYLLFPTRRGLPLSLAAIASADLVISRGGYLFVGGDKARNALSLFSIAFPLLYARRLGKKTMTMPTSIGPLRRSRLQRCVLRRVLRSIDLVIARDPLSYQTAISLGLDPDRLTELPDSVFLLRAQRCEAVPRGRMAITERHDAAPAEELITDVAVRLLSNGLIDSCVGVPQVDSDVAATQSVIKAVNSRIDNSALMIDEDLSVEALIGVYGSADVTLSHHLHACVLSMLAGTPAIAISTDGAKIEGIYSCLGIPSRWVVDVDSPAEIVARLVLDAGSSGDLVRAAVSAAHAELARGLQEAFEIALPMGEPGQIPRPRP